jgi:hypothetical protein
MPGPMSQAHGQADGPGPWTGSMSWALGLGPRPGHLVMGRNLLQKRVPNLNQLYFWGSLK